MRFGAIAADDMVEVDIHARVVVGRVAEVSDRIVYFRPICPGVGWRHANAREIATHWRKTRATRRHGRRREWRSVLSSAPRAAVVPGSATLSSQSAIELCDATWNVVTGWIAPVPDARTATRSSLQRGCGRWACASTW